MKKWFVKECVSSQYFRRVQEVQAKEKKFNMVSEFTLSVEHVQENIREKDVKK